MNRLNQSKNGRLNKNGGRSLEPHSQTDDTPDSRAIFEGQVRECFGRVVYSHKTHEKCADILLERLAKIKLAQIVLSALTTAGFISVVFGSGAVGAAFGALVSTVLLVLSSYVKDYDLGELGQRLSHRRRYLGF